MGCTASNKPNMFYFRISTVSQRSITYELGTRNPGPRARDSLSEGQAHPGRAAAAARPRPDRVSELAGAPGHGGHVRGRAGAVRSDRIIGCLPRCCPGPPVTWPAGRSGITGCVRLLVTGGTPGTRDGTPGVRSDPAPRGAPAGGGAPGHYRSTGRARDRARPGGGNDRRGARPGRA
eukprot:758479-Hanusia_phi.AAC.1